VKDNMPYIPHKYKLDRVRKITDNVKLFSIKTKINPHPGQFFQVSVLGAGECPLASCTSEYNKIEILVRNAGNVTSSLFELKKGDPVYIRGPYGKGFPLDKLRGKDIILLAGGTGIAPVTSMIEYIRKNRKDFGKIEIYFGFRDENYILLKDKIKIWEKKFKVIICLDHPGKKWVGESGLVCHKVDKTMIKPENAAVLLCGPEIMMKMATEMLNKQGFSNDQIYWSMERRMECGFGNCGRCLLQDLYVCKDGPVFKYSIIKEKIENEQN